MFFFSQGKCIGFKTTHYYLKTIFAFGAHFLPNNVLSLKTLNSRKIAKISKEAERQTDCLKAPFK